MKKFLLNLVTEPDNQTACPIRVLAILGVLQYLGLAAAHYFQHAVFDAQGFAMGFGTILGGAGVALGLKKDSSINGR